jgi:hypothetical protein
MIAARRRPLRCIEYGTLIYLALTGAGCHRRIHQQLPGALVACSVEPAVVDADTPVKVSIVPQGFPSRSILSYAYTVGAGKLEGSGKVVTVDTAGLAPGTYTVSVQVMDNGKDKDFRTANCKTEFSIKEPPKHPPVLSVAISPSSVRAGDRAKVTASGRSPNSRPLSYNCAASAGQLVGSGPEYTLETAGLPESNVTVNCTVSDDRELTATASAGLHISVPAPAPVAKAFGTLEVKGDATGPGRLDDKTQLDRFADFLTQNPDNKAVVVGYATEKELSLTDSKAPSLSAQRAVNAKNYLVRERGIDPRRVEVRSATGSKRTELWNVPAGATLSLEGAAPVDEHAIEAVHRVPLEGPVTITPVGALAQSFSDYINAKVAIAKQGQMDLIPPPSAVFAGDTFPLSAVITRPAEGQSMTAIAGQTGESEPPAVSGGQGVTGRNSVTKTPVNQISALLRVDDKMHVALKSETPGICTAPKDDDSSQQMDFRLPESGGSATWQWDIKASDKGDCVLKAFAYLVYCNPQVADCNQHPDRVPVLSKTMTVTIGVAQEAPWYARLAKAVFSAIQAHWTAILVFLLPGGAGYAAWQKWGRRGGSNRRKERTKNTRL